MIPTFLSCIRVETCTASYVDIRVLRGSDCPIFVGKGVINFRRKNIVLLIFSLSLNCCISRVVEDVSSTSINNVHISYLVVVSRRYPLTPSCSPCAGYWQVLYFCRPVSFGVCVEDETYREVWDELRGLFHGILVLFRETTICPGSSCFQDASPRRGFVMFTG